jgi:DNA-binding NarL/FixJ family response regulator
MENSSLLILNDLEKNLLKVLKLNYNLIESDFDIEFDYKSLKFDLMILNLKSDEDLKIIKFFRNNPDFDYMPIVCVCSKTFKYINIELVQNGCDACFIMPVNFEEFNINIIAILKRYKEIYHSSISAILPHLTNNHPDLKLTCREKDLLSEIAKGLTNIEIAETLFLSEMTVKTHLKNIYKKLNVSNRTEAIIVAMKNNLLEA